LQWYLAVPAEIQGLFASAVVASIPYFIYGGRKTEES
jgi:hypothetical protein